MKLSARNVFSVAICLVVFCVSVEKASAATTLKAVSDIISTSRPSPSTMLANPVLVGDIFANINNNGSTFLASDSAHFWDSSLENIIVASVSATNGQVAFATGAKSAHSVGTVISYAVTAVHTISFTTQTIIPVGGKIVLSFPVSGIADNQASPSAKTFMLNNLAASNMQANFSGGSSTCSFGLGGINGGSNPQIVCTIGNAQVNPNTTVTILLGCSVSGTSCPAANQVPTIINPTKAQTLGTADIWTLSIQTTDASNVVLDSASTRIGTVESVTLLAHVDPTFTFILQGVSNGTALNSICTNGGINNDITNTGFASTPSLVNLGTLNYSQLTIGAQKMIVQSNTITGYTVTATSSGHLTNTTNGYFFQDAQGVVTANDTPNPKTATAIVVPGSNRFGIHPCDSSSQSRVNTSFWGGGTGSTSYFANPSKSYYYTLVNSNKGPSPNGDTFYIEYAASPQINTPPGTYNTGLTYVVSTTF